MSHPEKTPVVRIAPSPTGNLHIGTARAALFNFLYSKKHGGKFILRIEDTDKERNKPEYEKNITDGLSWLGISWDEFYRQSERVEIYRSHLKKLIENGKAYISKETPLKEGWREEVIRFKNTNVKIKFDDVIRGEVEFDTTELGDFVIARSLDEPLYHLAVAIDDFEMGVTHVIRGEDHISNTPRQILIAEALGAARPIYAHIPLILAPDRSKLSKRHGAVALTEYRDRGYLPEAMLNYLALLGWNPGGEEELFTISQLIELFDLGRVQKGGAVFNIDKLNWFNREYIKQSPEIVKKEIMKITSTDISTAEKFLPPVLERISTLGNIKNLFNGGELDFLNEPKCPKEKLPWKGETSNTAGKNLEKIKALFESLDEKRFTIENIKAVTMPFAESAGRGSVLWPLRYALTGKEKSPDPFSVAYILGKNESLARIGRAIKTLNA
ncbi:MAG: glutamate--tRNA ligase family protein [Patescibacteria group bacterium]